MQKYIIISNYIYFYNEKSLLMFSVALIVKNTVQSEEHRIEKPRVQQEHRGMSTGRFDSTGY